MSFRDKLRPAPIINGDAQDIGLLTGNPKYNGLYISGLQLRLLDTEEEFQAFIEELVRDNTRH